jgi:hypothetical protein
MTTKKRLKKLSARKNVYGNWNVYDGRRNISKYGERFDAAYRVMELLDSGDYVLSPNSDITAKEIDTLRASLSKAARRESAGKSTET